MSDKRSTVTLEGLIGQIRDRIARLERSGIAQPSYTVATRPAATAVQAGTIVYVSDAGAGLQFQGSDGTVWRTLG